MDEASYGLPTRLIRVLGLRDLLVIIGNKMVGLGNKLKQVIFLVCVKMGGLQILYRQLFL